MGKQFTLIISIIIITGTIGIPLFSADRGEVSLEYKLKPGEQFSKKINIAFKVTGKSTGESQFTILCPVTSIVSEIDATIFIEELEGNFSEVAIVDDSPVPAPSGVMAEPLEGENDVRLIWEAPEDERVKGYDILADDKKVARVRAQTKFTHVNLEVGATVSYSVVSLVTEELKSKPSDVTNAVVGEDTTYPEPPMDVEEAIGDDGSVKITWRASSSKDISGYEILRGASLEDMRKIATLPADKTEYVDENAQEAEIHTVRSTDIE